MVINAFENYQCQFERLARAWIACGATQVSLCQDGIEILAYPLSGVAQGAYLLARLDPPGLELRVYHLPAEPWQDMLEAQLEWIASLAAAELEMENLTSALVETQDRLVALYELSQAARRHVEIRAVLDLLVSEVYRQMDCERAFAVLFQPGGEVLISQSDPDGLPPAELTALAQRLRAIPEQRLLHLELGPQASSLQLVALPVRKTVFGVLGLVRESHASFKTPDIKMVQAIADQIGAQLENALLTQEALLRARIETEMNLARQVQMSLLPQSFPAAPGLDVYGASVPASQVGGDFYNLVAGPGESFSFYVGDITGKGIPAALMMTMTRTVANSLVRAVPPVSPGDLVGRINSELAADFFNAGMFTTLFLGQHFPPTRRLTFTNAGQSPVLFAPVGGDACLLLAEDLPVGVVTDVSYSQQTLDLEVGDVLVAATDGFNESWNQGEEMFGIQRLLYLLDQIKGLPAAEIAARLFAAVDAFSAEHPQDDDRTLVVIKAVPMDGEVALEFPADLDELPAVSATLTSLLRRCLGQTLAERDRYACELVLQELLSNLVRHACVENPQLHIQVRLSLDAAARILRVETSDPGRENHLDLQEIEMPVPDGLREGGYGMPLIHALVDSIAYRREGDRNLWSLAKSFPVEIDPPLPGPLPL